MLRGWGPTPEQPARHDMTYKDVRVRNVPTNIRSWIGGGTERHGNSIFIFEMANMCIAHLGHLHHTLNQQQLNEIGRVDVVFVPVDGSMTLDLEGMMEVLQRAQGAADDPDALLQHLHAEPLPGPRAKELGRGDSDTPSLRGLEDDAAGEAEGAGAAGTLDAHTGWNCRRRAVGAVAGAAARARRHRLRGAGEREPRICRGRVRAGLLEQGTVDSA